MDQNLNLLKANQHKGTNQFMDIMMDFDMIPTITRPMCITNTTATLIDNIYISGKIQCNYESHLILSDISDHLPSLLLLKQTKVKDKTPIDFKSRNLNDDKIMKINNELRSINWNGLLNSNNCNTNFNTFCNEIKTSMDKVAPVKTIRISGQRRFIEPWLTTGLERSSRTLKKLYKTSLMEGATETEKKIYKDFRNIYNRTKRAMMKKFYSDKSSEYRTNTKKLWELMNSVIGKNKNKGCSISHLTVDGVKIFNNKMIAEEFAKFYSNLGESLAPKITPGFKPAEHYLSLIPRIVNSLVFSGTNATEIEKIIDRLPNKASSGYDGVSNILLKKLRKSLSYPLGIIFNQSIATGYFPDMMKVAEIIPLYKGKEEDQVINYRPVSLLMTISKILEKIIYNRVFKFLTKHNILYDSQYGFRSKHSCEDAILELVGKAPPVGPPGGVAPLSASSAVITVVSVVSSTITSRRP